MNRTESRIIIHAALAILVVLTLVGCRDTGEPMAPGPVGGVETAVVAQAQVETEVRPATIRRIVDGDTVTVEPSQHFPANYNCWKGTCKEHAIRLLGIDAPEVNKTTDKQPECGAESATGNLAAMLLDGDTGVAVTVVTDSVADAADRYGRTLAYVEVDGLDVGGAQVAQGYAAAWYPTGEPEPDRYPTYLHDQLTAERDLLGLHATCDHLGRN